MKAGEECLDRRSLGSPDRKERTRSTMREEDFAVCDQCGERTEEIILVDGSWICRECSQMP